VGACGWERAHAAGASAGLRKRTSEHGRRALGRERSWASRVRREAGIGCALGGPAREKGGGWLGEHALARWAGQGRPHGSRRGRGHTRGPTLSKRGKGGFGPRREGKGRLGFYLFISYFFIFCSFLFSPPFQIEFLIKWMLHKITHPIE
jgi:hypothetical protein